MTDVSTCVVSFYNFTAVFLCVKKSTLYKYYVLLDFFLICKFILAVFKLNQMITFSIILQLSWQ